MISLRVVVIATVLFWGPLICVSHAQQAQTESQAVQLIGLAGFGTKHERPPDGFKWNSAFRLCEGHR
jgi:hypothetical protein